MKPKIFLLSALLLAFLTASAWAAPKEPKNKLGAAHHTHSGASYSVTEDGNTSTASEPLVGVNFFYERMFLSRFSTGLRYSGMLERSMEMNNGTDNLKILEKVSFTALDFKAYFKNHSMGGTKGYLGVGYGIYSVTSTVSITPSGSSTTTEETSTASVPITLLNVGLDYIKEFGGIRFDFALATGQRNDLTGLTGREATYNYTGSILNIGVFSFF